MSDTYTVECSDGSITLTREMLCKLPLMRSLLDDCDSGGDNCHPRDPIPVDCDLMGMFAALAFNGQFPEDQRKVLQYWQLIDEDAVSIEGELREAEVERFHAQEEINILDWVSNEARKCAVCDEYCAFNINEYSYPGMYAKYCHDHKCEVGHCIRIRGHDKDSHGNKKYHVEITGGYW